MNGHECQHVLLVVGLITVHAWGEEATAPLTADTDKNRPPVRLLGAAGGGAACLANGEARLVVRTPVDRFVWPS